MKKMEATMKTLPEGTVIRFFTVTSDDDGISFFATKAEANETRNQWIKTGANGVSEIVEHEVLAGGFETYQQLQSQNTARELLEALKATKRLLECGWITPEGKSSDYEDGWEDACAEFRISGTLKQVNAAIAKSKA